MIPTLDRRQVRARSLTGREDEHARGDRQHDGEAEERPEAESTDDPFADERGYGRGREARHAVDAERPSPTRGRDQVDHIGKVRDEERGVREPLERPHQREEPDGRRRQREQRGHSEQRDAEQHERLLADRVDPRPDQRLTDDADPAVEAHDEPDLDLRAAELMDVERQQDERVQAREEEEAGGGRAGERGDVRRRPWAPSVLSPRSAGRPRR